MNQNNRICMFQGHQEYQVTHICTLNECDLASRWCCIECLQKGVHNHKKQDDNPVMNRKELHAKVMNQYEIVKKDIDQYQSTELPLFQKILKELQRIEQALINYRNQYYDIEKYMQNIRSNFEQCLGNIQENKFQQLDDDKIQQILNINQYKFDQQNSRQQLQQQVDNIKLSFSQIEIIIKEWQDNKKNKNNNNISNKIIDYKTRKYITQQIDFTNTLFYGSSISKNEQYLAYGGQDKILKIYDIKLKKISKEIKLDNQLYVCQFTQDSSQLYIGQIGYAHGYDVQDDFKEIFKQQIHSSNIYNIITIQNQYLITCSDDKFIIKTDIKSKQQIFKLTAHWSIAIDYNDKDNIIVSGSNDKSIKLWNCRNQSIIINKEKSHNNIIRQIQLINNNLNILSLDWDGNLYKWKIDLTNKDLIKLQQFSDQNKILNFYQVNQDQNLLLICNNYAKILNLQGETINTIEHGVQDSTQRDCRQLDNVKYIQIRANSIIMLAIAQD